MNYEFPLWQPSRKYVCPPDAGPAWREACEAGFDMAEIEDNLKLSVWERMEKHDRKLNDFLKREQFLEMLERGMSFIRRVESNRLARQSKI